jgi:hypothetical protein
MTFQNVTTSVKSDEGFAQVVNVLLTRQFAPWVNRVIRLLLLVGIAAVLYVAVAIGLAIWHRTR